MTTATEQREWLTLRDCAADLQVDVELVRRWCIAHEHGRADGLPSAHFGEEADPAQAKRKCRRVHADDWARFKEQRRRREANEGRRASVVSVAAREAKPLDYPMRKPPGAAKQNASG